MLWQMRHDRRKQFIENQLETFVATANPVRPTSLRQSQKHVAMFLPQKLNIALNAAFEATGNGVKWAHLPLFAIPITMSVFGFTTAILALKPVLVMLLCILTAIGSPIVALWLAKLRYQRKFLDIFPDALDLIGRAVKAGLPVNEALLIAGNESPDPVGRELRRAFDQVQIGMQMIGALEQTANRVQVADFRFLVVALALQQKSGGSLAETLKNLSTVIRARKTLRLKARSLSAEAKVSAVILAILPFIVGVLMFLMNRELASVLVVDPRGRFMLGIAFLSLVMGLGTMVIMVKRALR
jgi:tight adherence protein B